MFGPLRPNPLIGQVTAVRMMDALADRYEAAALKATGEGRRVYAAVLRDRAGRLRLAREQLAAHARHRVPASR